MIVETLSLRDFRNIAEAELSPCGGINILLGDNAQGKTNLVEALWLCTGSPSFRGGQEKAMVRFGAEAFGDASRAAVEDMIADISGALNG